MRVFSAMAVPVKPVCSEAPRSESPRSIAYYNDQKRTHFEWSTPGSADYDFERAHVLEWMMMSKVAGRLLRVVGCFF